MIYYHKQDYISKGKLARIDVQSIMFLSRCLNTTKRNYWLTKLKIADIIWVVKKIRHIIKSSQKPPVVVYTNHSAAISISKQTILNISSTNKLNLRLIRAFQYLSSFNLELRHKAGKTNIVLNALSRLLQITITPASLDQFEEKALNTLYDYTDS